MAWTGRGLKEQVSALGKGWGIREHNKVIRIHHRVGSKQVSAPLGLKWHEGNTRQAYNRAEAVFKLVSSGVPIKEAAKKIVGGSLQNEEDWKGALARFKKQKINHGNAIKESTWDGDYEQPLSMALKLLLSKKAPTNPADLLDACVKDWKPGTETRKRRARSIAQFLKHCVVRENFPSAWIPPVDLKSHIGRLAANTKSQKMNAISDAEIMSVIDSIPGDEPGKRWAFAIRLMAENGLRPVELKHLHLRTDPKTGEKYIWCSYEKRSGGGVTRPRRLYPLPLAGQKWNLVMLLEANLIKLPPLDSKNGAGEAARKYLERRPAWNALFKKLKDRKENLGTYSFRHSYSVRGHQLNIDGGSMADMMGHTYETHCREYPFATEKTTMTAYQKAMGLADAART